MRKEVSKICLECKTLFNTRYNGKFCGLSCSSKYNNRLRPPMHDEIKLKIKDGIKQHYIDHPEKLRPKQRGQEYVKFIGSFTKGKFKGKFIESLLDVSKRTASKILKRLDLGCCICGWKEASCDIHHINGKKVERCNEHWNLTLICPNHHRMYHNNKLKKEDFISLDKYFPENWRDVYYG